MGLPGSVATDFGGFVGYGNELNNADVWVAGTSQNTINRAEDFTDLQDTGKWESI
ncbi:hypothetical protein [Okeania sp.]|uniref:hypothetical protein n=1 Tax=Okeania sp. TaxID=3100323 RepID=UPI002B4B56E2|nr:hypothetical protein [Okeania sp.]MEB3342315.1 hypothetical protein [Okeania sp.]